MKLILLHILIRLYLKPKLLKTRDFRLPSRCKLCLRSFATLRCVKYQKSVKLVLSTQSIVLASLNARHFGYNSIYMFRLFIKPTIKLDYYKIQTYKCNLLPHQFTCVNFTPYNTLFYILLLLVYSCGDFKFLFYCHIFLHSVFCLTTGPKPPPKRSLHIVWSRASSFKWEYPLLSLRSSSSYLSLLPRLLVTSTSPFIFPSITCFRRQLLRKMWPIQLASRFLISCRIFLCSLTLNNTSSFLTWSVQLIFSILLQHHISKLSRYFWSTARSVKVSAPYKTMLKMWHFTSFFLKFNSNLLVKLVIICIILIKLYTYHRILKAF